MIMKIVTPAIEFRIKKGPKGLIIGTISGKRLGDALSKFGLEAGDSVILMKRNDFEQLKKGKEG